MGFFVSRLIRNLVLIYAIFLGVQYVLRIKSYTFSPKEFRAAAANAQGADGAVVLKGQLRRIYGHLIVDQPEWVPLSGGGLNLRAQFLHASITEYIALISAPFQTNGRGGFHFTNSTCVVLKGQVTRLPDGASEGKREVFSPGQNFRHGQFESFFYELDTDSSVACYGRGLVPVSGFWTTLGSLSNGDVVGLARLSLNYAQSVYEQTALHLAAIFAHYKSKISQKVEL